MNLPWTTYPQDPASHPLGPAHFPPPCLVDLAYTAWSSILGHETQAHSFNYAGWWGPFIQLYRVMGAHLTIIQPYGVMGPNHTNIQSDGGPIIQPYRVMWVQSYNHTGWWGPIIQAYMVMGPNHTIIQGDGAQSQNKVKNMSCRNLGVPLSLFKPESTFVRWDCCCPQYSCCKNSTMHGMEHRFNNR